jgi:hypothetical protein
MSHVSTEKKLPRLLDILSEQDKSDSVGYYILDLKYGKTIISDQSDLKITKKTFIAKGVNLIVLASLNLKAKMINDGIITIGSNVKNLVKVTLDGHIENNNEIQNNAIFIISKSGSIKQESDSEFTNNGIFENNGLIENAGVIHNNMFLTNRGSLETKNNGTLQISANGVYTDKTYTYAY